VLPLLFPVIALLGSSLPRRDDLCRRLPGDAFWPAIGLVSCHHANLNKLLDAGHVDIFPNI
jgi:hypothetical protein